MTKPASNPPPPPPAPDVLEQCAAETAAPLERLKRAAEGVRLAGAKLKRTASDPTFRAVRPDADASAPRRVRRSTEP